MNTLDAPSPKSDETVAFQADAADAPWFMPGRWAPRWALNLTHAGFHAFVLAFSLFLLLGSVAAAAFSHVSFVRLHPWSLLWIAASLGLGVVSFYLNLAGVRLRGKTVSYLVYGIMACFIGLVLQSLAHFFLLHALAPRPLGILADWLLGAGTALSQTLGKWVSVAFLYRVWRPKAPSDVLGIGLAVGLGFGLAEVLLMGQGFIAREWAMEGGALLSIWERGIMVLFHIYSAALIAIAYACHKWNLIGAVMLLQTLNNGLAGGVEAGGPFLPVSVTETVFLGVALFTWVLYLRTKASLRIGAL